MCDTTQGHQAGSQRMCRGERIALESSTGQDDNSSARSDRSCQSDVSMSDQQPADQPAAVFEPNNNAPKRVFKMSDEFLMFKFKIEMCSRKDRHDWKVCPYAHPGEVARRRHPRGYTAVLCPAKTAAACPRREHCTFAHNPFEFWLHPDRFKTSLCNQGPTCDRPICFFAHKDEELRRLPNGLEAAGPDDYVYATAATLPEPAEQTAASVPPPPPPPPRITLANAGSSGLGLLNNNAVVAAAAAAAAAQAASLSSSGLLLGASPTQLMLLNGDNTLAQQANQGFMADGSYLGASSWLNSSSDAPMLGSLAGAGRQLPRASPVPLPLSSTASSSSGGFRGSLAAASSGSAMAMSFDPAAMLAASSLGGVDASALAGLSSQLNAPMSLATAVNVTGSRAASGLVGSAPAGYSLLQDETAGSSYQQQLLQHLQFEHQQQQQLLQEHLWVQQQLALMQQQQQAVLSGSCGINLGQLVQQGQVQFQHAMPQVSSSQQATGAVNGFNGNNSLLCSQSLAASGAAAQLSWRQQQQPLQADVQLNPGSYSSSRGSVEAADSSLAAALGLAGPASAGVGGAGAFGQMPYTGIAGMHFEAPDQQGSLKWSNSILSRQSGPAHDESSSLNGLSRSPEQPGNATCAATTAASIEQLNGLLQMVHVSSSTAMMAPK